MHSQDLMQATVESLCKIVNSLKSSMISLVVYPNDIRISFKVYTSYYCEW